jgi:hypothetical protein
MRLSSWKTPATLAIATLALVPALARGQAPPADNVIPDADRRQVIPFLEGTDVFVSVPRSKMLFEADIQPNLVASQNFSDKLTIDESLTGRWRMAYSIVGTPRVRLRMYNERSVPVRTPSYMPKGSVSLLLFRGEAAEPRHRVGIWSPQLTIGHHSNGQDGCLFEDDVMVDGKCIGGTSDLTKINRKDGNFSTNYVRIGGRYRREWLSTLNAGRTDEEHVGTSNLTLGIDLDLHFKTDERLAPFYGQRRVRGMVSYANQLHHVCRSRAAVTATVLFVGTDPDTVPPIAYQLEGVCTFSNQGGWGALVRYTDGQGNYNLAFAEHVRRLEIGVHYEQDGFLRFITSAAKREIDERRRQRGRLD